MPRISENNNIKLYNQSLAAGVIGSAPVWNDNDDGTYDLGEFTVLLYDNPNHEGGLKQFTIAPSAGRSLQDTPNEIRYSVVDYNAGTPIIRDLLYAELSEINESDIIPLFTMLNDNNVHIHVVHWDTLGQSLSNQTHKRIVKTDRIKREAGAALSTGAGADHHIELTSARYWLGSVEHDLVACDTSSAMGDIVSYDGNSGTGATFAIWGVNDPPGNGGAIHLQVKSGGSGYASDETGVAVTGGSGSGLTIDYHQVGGEIVSATVNAEGINYETTTSLYFYHYTGTGLTFDTLQTAGEITSLGVSSGGTGYFQGDVIEIIGNPTGTGATVRLDNVIGGVVQIGGVTLLTGGSGYTSELGATTYEGWTYQQYAAQDGVYPNNGYNTSAGFFDTGSNDWVVAWIYRDLEDEPHFGYVLATEAYGSFAEASASQPRGDLPIQFGVMADLVGRIICKDGLNVDASSPNTGKVESAFGIEFSGTPVTSHNSLASLQGGIASQYYHLSSEQHGYITTPTPSGLGADYLHGMGDVATTLAFDDVTHVFTISGTDWFYYYQGKRVNFAGASSATIDLDTAGVGFPFVGLTFIYFDDATGVLTATTTPWNLENHIPVSLLYWNSATGTGQGAITDERHGFRRDLQWHSWAHSALNTRYISGLDLTLPSVGTPNQIDIASGVVADEDIRHAIPNTTNSRIWRETAANVWTFTDDTLPYYDTTTGTGGSPEWPHSGSSYTPTALTPGFYMPVFCYGTGDEDRSIYIVVPSMSASNLYGDVSSAREHPFPTPSFAAEMKLLYRFIFDDTGAFFYDAVQDDYRLAIGKTGSEGGAVTASGVSFSPYSTIAATNVQAAIEELADEAGGAGATIADNTTTNASYYPTMSFTTSGTFTDATISTTKLYFNPSTGTLNSTVFNTLSDASYKTNIVPINNATDIIKQLEGVGFNWIDNGNKSYGVIAQELEKVIPELVSDGDTKSVNYDGLIAFLINAVKEMDARINELESK